MQYSLDLRDTAGGYIDGEPVNLPLLTAWLQAAGITGIFIQIDPVDVWVAHVTASAEPNMLDDWPRYINSVSWQTGDPLPTTPTPGTALDEAPATVTYQLDLTDTTLGYTAGDAIRTDMISQYLTDNGVGALSVAALTDGDGVTTGVVEVTRLASVASLTPTLWAAYNGADSVDIYGQISIGGGDPDVSAQQGTRLGDESVASGIHATALGGYSRVTGDDGTGVGHNSLVTGDFATSLGAQSTADATQGTSVGGGATVNAGSDRSTAVGSQATVLPATPDVGVWRNNSLELVPSRPSGFSDPTLLKLHASDGSVHAIGVTPDGLTWDALPVIRHPAVKRVGGASISSTTYAAAATIGTVNVPLLAGVIYDIDLHVFFTGIASGGAATCRVSSSINGVVSNGPSVQWDTAGTASHGWFQLATVTGAGTDIACTVDLTTTFTGTVIGRAWGLRAVASPRS